ncbi:MAG: radical SAM protein [Akkermansiaceae bacterium]|nr:radical SAM protein [Akkermansiaceae bacterium]
MSKFTTFLLKVASRCNLDCTYCYEFKLADQSWKDQPHLMTSEVWRVSAEKISDYALKHELLSVGINLHGGEPLLLGKKNIRFLLSDFKSILSKNNINVSYGLQTNGVLLDQEWLDIFSEFNVRIGISLDGDPNAHDKNRVFFSGKGSYAIVREAINLCLSQAKNREVFGGTLAVIDVESDPIEVLHHFLDIGVKTVDFLFPDANWDSLPPGKKHFHETIYADWLIKVFNEYLRINDPSISIRIFETLIKLCLGYKHNMDIFGIAPIEILVISANGDLHALDSLKASLPTYLGKNILSDDFEYSTIAKTELGKAQTGGYENLADKCKACVNSLIPSFTYIRYG